MDLLDLARHVRTEAGVRRYHKPIGSLISGRETAKVVVRGARLATALAAAHTRGTGVSKGTLEDPINCAGNVVLAAKLLSEGKHIRLNREAEVGTLLDRLAYLTAEATKKGKDAPNIDLCRVSVPKTNLFCAQTKGIPRAQMPQLSGVPVKGSKADALPRVRGSEVDIIPEFRKELARRGIKITDTSMPADHLKATQDQLIGPKVAGIYEAMKAAPSNSGLFERIMVTKDGYVIDGHHRWASQVALETTKGTPRAKMRMKVTVLDVEIGAALDLSKAFAADWGIPQQGFVLNQPAVPKELSIGYDFLDDLVIDLARHVRTPEGAKKYHLPIGSLIVKHPDVSESVKVPLRKTPFVDEYQKAFAALKPGDSIPDTSTVGRSRLLDAAPVGASIEIRNYSLRRSVDPNASGTGPAAPTKVLGSHQIWTKVAGQDGTPHWESRDYGGGSTQWANDGNQLIQSAYGPTDYKIPPNFGGDIDKVLHPKNGDEITYTNPFDDKPRPETLRYSAEDGKFHGTKLPNSTFETPASLLSKVTISPDFMPGKATSDFLFWQVDADRFDGEFKGGVIPDHPFGTDPERVPLKVPSGWSQVTPREAFADDAQLAAGYYSRFGRATNLRLFKGSHGEVAVVDDARAKHLTDFLSGLSAAMELVGEAPGIKNPGPKHKYLTFTVPEQWEGRSDALAFVRGNLPDDVQVNPGLLDGTFQAGESSESQTETLHRITTPSNPGGIPWWAPAMGKATDNLFTGTLSHELGHVNDGRRGDTGTGGIDADPRALSFWRAHLGISQYGATNAAEGYAEAFAEWFAEQHLTSKQLDEIPVKVRLAAGAYAVEYGWSGAPKPATVLHPYGP